MKFKDYPYKRPDEKEILSRLDDLKKELETAKDYQSFFNAFRAYDALLADEETMANICSVRHTIDTQDEFYNAESDYFDEIGPVIDSKRTEIDRAILDSPFVRDLRNDVPETWFLKHEMMQKTIAPEIVEDLKLENKIASEYQKLIASAQIEFDGQTWTLASLEEKMNDPDRSVRERAHKAYWGWYADHEKEIGDIYGKLVALRTQIAQKMGYENYIPFGYQRMTRLDYDRNDVETYRRNILRDVVPVAMELYSAQAKRLGYDSPSLPVWDEKVKFESGNPKPHFERDVLVDHAREMYHELSDETGKFFDAMVENELMDLDSKPGKAAGGYCTSFPAMKTPFIFANFNHTQHDAEVLTHEAGHAFQMWESRDIFPSDCVWPTMESAEIDSMSMEFFTWPWMKGFFEEDTDKYHYTHLEGAVQFLPYGVLVDHFQHEVYANPQWTNDERMACWRRLEKEYLPQKNYDDIDFLERGGWWMRQLHIFMDPFYYIDYTLAQVAALQFWSRLQKKDPKAFEDYLKICKAGGTLPFTGLIRLASLKVPFEDGCLSDTMADVRAWVEKWNAEHPDLR